MWKILHCPYYTVSKKGKKRKKEGLSNIIIEKKCCFYLIGKMSGKIYIKIITVAISGQ